MTETFADRDDFLVYRATTYDEQETALRAAEAEAHAQALAAMRRQRPGSAARRRRRWSPLRP